MAGHEPIKGKPRPHRGADFVAKFMTASSDPDIPAGTTAKIEITATDKTNARSSLPGGSRRHDEHHHLPHRIRCGRRDSGPVPLPAPGVDSRFPTLDLCWFYGMVLRMQ